MWTPKRDEWEKIFAFAKNMGLEYVSAEPAREDWDVVEKYAKQYNIGLSTHNHPNDASYWKPEILLSCIGTRSELLGSCADVGHFKRMNRYTNRKGELTRCISKTLHPKRGKKTSKMLCGVRECSI